MASLIILSLFETILSLHIHVCLYCHICICHSSCCHVLWTERIKYFVFVFVFVSYVRFVNVLLLQSTVK